MNALLLYGPVAMATVLAILAFRKWTRPSTPQALPPAEPAPSRLEWPDGTRVHLRAHLGGSHGYPMLDWDAANAAAGGALTPEQSGALRRGWLLHLRDALGPAFHLRESSHALALSSLEPATADALLRYVATTRSRIERVLQGVAAFPPGERSIVLVLDDEDAYYRYVAHYYPEEGEFGFSGGMFLGGPCPHFVVRRDDLKAIEPVVAHEMTHSALAHLHLPRWLDEGLAVNTERRLAGSTPNQHTAQQLHGKHVAFWTPATIQEFWSGESFFRTDDGQMLSYELARVLVQEFSRDWAPFAAFVRDADADDAGHAAALEHLGVDLGAAVCALFDKDPDAGWAPEAAHQASPA